MIKVKVIIPKEDQKEMNTEGLAETIADSFEEHVEGTVRVKVDIFEDSK